MTYDCASAPEPRCESCRWWHEPNMVCCNENSEHIADFTLPDDRCEEYEAIESRGS